MNKIKKKLLLLTLISSMTGSLASCNRSDFFIVNGHKETDTGNKDRVEEFVEDMQVTTSQDIVATDDIIVVPTLPIVDSTQPIIVIPDSVPEYIESITEETEYTEPIVVDTIPEYTEPQYTEDRIPVDDPGFIEPEEVKPYYGDSYRYHTITATTGVNVRRAPEDGEVIAILPEGESLTVLGLEGEWYKCLYNGIECYVSSRYSYLNEDHYIEVPDSLSAEVYEYPVIVATGNVNIRLEPKDGEIVGILPIGKKLTLISEEDGWYKCLYYGKEVYVSGKYAYQDTSFAVNGDIKKIVYATDELTIYIPYEINENGMVGTIRELECLEVYGETDDLYLVKTIDYVGYVPKRSLKELSGTFVVIDISEQNLKLYVDNEIVVDTPVVTGKPETPSDTGLFKVYDIDYNRYLVGDGYKSYVDRFAPYNGGEGLHDAEVHRHEDGTRHGWRKYSAFGGETYIKNGSHGCINMRQDDSATVFDYLERGTKVLVKE